MKLTTFLLLLTCAASAAPVGKRVDIGGRTLHIVCMGEGPRTVLMESGAAEGFYEWWLVQSALKGEIRTCSYDRAGFGWSDPPSSERSVANYISDLHELLRRNGEKPPFILAGHSMGGSIVQRYYWRYPSEVAGIIAVDPINAESNQAKVPEMQQAIAAHRARRTKEMEAWRASGNWPKQDFPSALPVDLRAQLIAASASRNWWEARFGEGALPDLDVTMSAEERHIGVPLVVIAARWTKPAGWSDEATERFRQHWLDGQKEIASRSEHSRIVFTDVGHEVPIEAPELIAREIRAMARVVWP
ncbi:MAG TPA: alpha/beta hydrolase [Thermoanaerobaculia bacterium]|nr:alpha/beta hydrolase [Thermoanaerobaculia bacterium]